MAVHPNEVMRSDATEQIQLHRMEVPTGWTDDDLIRHLEGEVDGKGITRGSDVITSQILEKHCEKSHSPKDPSCPVCQQATGTSHIHHYCPELEKATRILHVDLSGPHEPGWPYDYRYILIAVARVQKTDGSNYSLLPFVRCLPNKTSLECLGALSSVLNQIEALTLPLAMPGQRITRVHTDRGTEFFGETLQADLFRRHVHHTFTVGYDPKANGTAERFVGVVKSMGRKLLFGAKLEENTGRIH